MKYSKIIVPLLVLILVAPVVRSQQDDQVDKVILASESNFPDALVSSKVSQKLGIPVLLTEKGEINDEVLSTLEDISPDQIIVVGGPEVIDEEVIQQLQDQGFETNRLWGMSRYGTANEVVNHFWPEGAEKALLVENKIGEDQGNILGMAKNLANGQPMIPIPEGKIPADTMSLLKDLGVKEVTMIGQEISSTAEENLNSIGINITEKIQSNNETELEEKIRNQTFKRMNNDSLIVVAVGNFKNVISAPNLPQSKSYLISNESEISNAVQTINENNITKVKVVGKPDLANIISSTLMNETNAEINQIIGEGEKASQIASNITGSNIPEFAKKFQRNHTRWMEGIEQNATKMMGIANETINKVQTMIDDYNATELNETLSEAQNLFEQGNFFEARKIARKAQNEIMNSKWMEVKDNATKFQQAIREETENLQEKVQQLTQLNQEFGNYMQQNMTIEQRLETIKTFQNRRKNQIRKVINQATQIGIGNITGKDNGNILNQVIKGPKPFKNQTRGPKMNNQTKTNQTNPGNNKGNGP